MQSHTWPLVRLFAVQRAGEGNRCARAAPSPSAAQGPCPQDCPLQTPPADDHCPAACTAAPTSGFNERHQVSTVLALPCLLSELYLTGCSEPCAGATQFHHLTAEILKVLSNERGHLEDLHWSGLLRVGLRRDQCGDRKVRSACPVPLFPHAHVACARARHRIYLHSRRCCRGRLLPRLARRSVRALRGA